MPVQCWGPLACLQTGAARRLGWAKSYLLAAAYSGARNRQLADIIHRHRATLVVKLCKVVAGKSGMPNSESELAKAARRQARGGNALYGHKASMSFALGWSLAFVLMGMRSSLLGFIRPE